MGTNKAKKENLILVRKKKWEVLIREWCFLPEKFDQKKEVRRSPFPVPLFEPLPTCPERVEATRQWWRVSTEKKK